MIDHFNHRLVKSPALAGLFFLTFIVACQAPRSADETTLAFWQAMAENDLATAKQYASSDSQTLLDSQEKKLENANFSIGEIVINDNQARVETFARLDDNSKFTFSTFLIQEEKNWRVDYPRTQQSLSNDLFNGFFESLKNISENLNKHLEQQLPRIEKQVESYGQELQKQLDQFGKEMEKAFPPPRENKHPYQDSI